MISRYGQRVGLNTNRRAFLLLIADVICWLAPVLVGHGTWHMPGEFEYTNGVLCRYGEAIREQDVLQKNLTSKGVNE